MVSMFAVWKLVHVTAVILWLGGAVLLTLLNTRAARVGDAAALQAIERHGEYLGRVVFGPSALLTLLAGGVLAWQLGGRVTLWMGWGIAAVVISIVIATAAMPRAVAALQAATAAGAAGMQLHTLQRRVARWAWLNLALLFSTVAVMIFKPTL